jgi:4'-phosphopantetheinyl transferase
MSAITPLIKPWSQDNTNKCTFDEIPTYWEAYDVLTFLVDLGVYRPFLYLVLNDCEKEQEYVFKTDYFKKRFTVSRSIAKFILQIILKTEEISDIDLSKKKNKRIMVKNRQDIYISLSYSCNCIAITIGKRKIGSDIEALREVCIKKIRSYPLFNDMNYRSEKECILIFLHVWTMIEAYAKLHDKNPFPYMNSVILPEDAHFKSYCINQCSIFTLAFCQQPLKDIVLWIDPECIETLPSGMNNAGNSSQLSNGNMDNRA